MSDDDKGGKILTFPGKKKKEQHKVPSLMSEMINNMFDTFTPEQKNEFQGYMTTNLELRFMLTDDDESFEMQEIPLLEDIELDIDLEDMSKMMHEVNEMKDQAFEYIKQIELAMFDAHFGYDHQLLTELKDKLRLICAKLPKKG
tara:strand:+ start:934 stop:1365 length:432 start_codon:yes stop_codon:yes gene_type:complete